MGSRFGSVCGCERTLEYWEVLVSLLVTLSFDLGVAWNVCFDTIVEYTMVAFE